MIEGEPPQVGSEQPDVAKRRRGDTALVCGLVGIWGFAHWMLLSTILWGATFCYGGRRSHRTGTDCHLETDLSVFWPTLIPWILLGPVFLGGTVIVLWIQRNDRI